MKTTNTIRYIDDKNAQVSKIFAKKACIFGTEEFKLWREYKAIFPEAQMIIKEIKKNPDKKTYKNLTYKNIEKFLRLQDNADNLIAAFTKQKELAAIQASPYHAVLDWFLEQFPNYDQSVAVVKVEVSKENSNVTSLCAVAN